MRLYQLPIPLCDNAGHPYSLQAREEFYSAVLRHCGGYTKLGLSDGAWRNPETGKVYKDRNMILQFATDKPAALAYIVQQFARYFPDQICAMVTDLGAVTFHNLQKEEVS